MKKIYMRYTNSKGNRHSACLTPCSVSDCVSEINIYGVIKGQSECIGEITIFYDKQTNEYIICHYRNSDNYYTYRIEA